jgi:putative DNA methylase
LPLPTAEIPSGHNTDQARRHNYTLWRQLFNHRQLLALGRLLRGILAEPDTRTREALLLLFSGALEFNNMFCSFKGEGTGAVRHLFAHHILRPPRTPLEANPWGPAGSSGSFLTLLERRLLAAKRYREAPFELRAARGPGGRTRAQKVFGLSAPVHPRLAGSFSELVSQRADVWLRTGDSSRLPLPDHSVDLVVTDPPYFDNVHYSELADFFHAWLQGPLGQARAPFRHRSTRSAREVQGVTATEFGARLRDVLTECARVMKPQAPLALTFHHSRTEGWMSLAAAIHDAGLRVVATHPVLAEMLSASPKRRSKEPIQLDLVVVCRCSSVVPKSRAPRGLPDLRERAARVARRQRRAGLQLSRGDLRVILMGQVLVAFGARAWPVRHRRRPFEEALEDALDALER